MLLLLASGDDADAIHAMLLFARGVGLALALLVLAQAFFALVPSGGSRRLLLRGAAVALLVGIGVTAAPSLLVGTGVAVGWAVLGGAIAGIALATRVALEIERRRTPKQRALAGALTRARDEADRFEQMIPEDAGEHDRALAAASAERPDDAYLAYLKRRRRPRSQAMRARRPSHPLGGVANLVLPAIAGAWAGALGLVAAAATAGRLPDLVVAALALLAVIALTGGLVSGGVLMALPLGIFLAPAPRTGRFSLRRGAGRLSGVEPLPDALASGLVTLAMQLSARRQDEAGGRQPAEQPARAG